jgi:hypothetical protein
MNNRLRLHEALCGVLGAGNVYFQPPESVKLQYPCIVYRLSAESTRFADDLPYARKKRYAVTVIDKKPDSEIPDRVAALPLCAFDRYFAAENLNHYTYNVYF